MRTITENEILIQATNVKTDIDLVRRIEGVTLQSLVNKLDETGIMKISHVNLSQKINRGAISYNDVVKIASALGYKIVWQKNKTGSDIK